MIYRLPNKNKRGGFNFVSLRSENMICITGANDDMDWGLIELYPEGIRLSSYIGDEKMDLAQFSKLKIVGIDVP